MANFVRISFICKFSFAVKAMWTEMVQFWLSCRAGSGDKFETRYSILIAMCADRERRGVMSV